MKRIHVGLVLVLLICVIANGCASYRVARLTEQRYPKKSKDENITLFEGELERPVIEIGVIDSFAIDEMTDYGKADQMDQIRRVARKLGADAVHKVEILQERVKGYVIDEQVPFKSWKQGRYKRYFIRGTAVKFADQ